MSLLLDFISLIYPRNCVSCGNTLFKHEDHLCNNCYLHLPKTNFHLSTNNPIENIFKGKVVLDFASSFYLFTKKGQIQKILHSIKYRDNKDLAILIGKWYGTELKNIYSISSADFIIPVPLHQKKYKQRGFNQSEEFAKGLSEALAIPLQTNNLIRKAYTSTQTRKTKYQRWENVEAVFDVTHLDKLKNKHLILVDDVITTGATIEACIIALQKIENVKISVLSIAYANLK